MIRFKSWEQMYEYLQLNGDLYNIEKGIYVFACNDLGALCTYNLNKINVKEIAQKANDIKKPWNHFLEIGGQILEDNYYNDYRYLEPSFNFCKESFNEIWCPTEDYLKLTDEKPLYKYELSLIDGSYTSELVRESHLFRRNAGKIFDNKPDKLYMYTTSEEFPDILAITAAEIVREKIEEYEKAILAQKQLRHIILHQMTNKKIMADLEERE